MAGREHRRHDIAHERRRRLAEGLRPAPAPLAARRRGREGRSQRMRDPVSDTCGTDCACLLEILDGLIELPAGEMVASDRVESPGLVLCVGVPPSVGVTRFSFPIGRPVASSPLAPYRSPGSAGGAPRWFCVARARCSRRSSPCPWSRDGHAELAWLAPAGSSAAGKHRDEAVRRFAALGACNPRLKRTLPADARRGEVDRRLTAHARTPGSLRTSRVHHPLNAGHPPPARVLQERSSGSRPPAPPAPGTS